jgi:hypothetical protein
MPNPNVGLPKRAKLLSRPPYNGDPTMLGATMTYTLANNAAAMMIRQTCVVRFHMSEV